MQQIMDTHQIKTKKVILVLIEKITYNMLGK